MFCLTCSVEISAHYFSVPDWNEVERRSGGWQKSEVRGQPATTPEADRSAQLAGEQRDGGCHTLKLIENKFNFNFKSKCVL